MACEKILDSDHDFKNDGLDLYMKNGYVKVRDTTLVCQQIVKRVNKKTFIDRQLRGGYNQTKEKAKESDDEPKRVYCSYPAVTPKGQE